MTSLSIRNMNHTIGERELDGKTNNPQSDLDWLKLILKNQPQRADELQPKIDALLIEIHGAEWEQTAAELRSVMGLIGMQETLDIRPGSEVDPIVNRLNKHAGYDVFSAMATKSPERVEWEREYLAKRAAQTRSFWTVKR